MDSSRELSLARLPAQDIAYEVLRQAGAPMSFHDLVNEVLRIKDVPAERRRRAMAETNTEINLDPRFQYLGSARWGLREWAEREPEVPSQLVDDEAAGEGDEDGGMGEED